jgi:hypothetical protein
MVNYKIFISGAPLKGRLMSFPANQGILKGKVSLYY